MIEISQIIAELRILEENIDEEKEHTRLTLRVACQMRGEYRTKLKEWQEWQEWQKGEENEQNDSE